MTGRVAAPILRRLLKDAPWAQERLRPFAGHHIAWDIANIKGSLRLDSEGLPEPLPELTDNNATQTNAGVHLSLPSEKLSVLGKGMDALMREVRIEGNAGLAAELAFIARHLRPDPAEWMAPYLGDIAAEQAGQQLNKAFAWSTHAAARVMRSGSDYLIFEAGIIPSPEQVSGHCHEIDNLRDATDRLAQRIARLEAGLKVKPTPH